MTILFLTLACFFTAVMFLIMFAVESQSEPKTAFRLLRKMTARNVADVEQVDAAQRLPLARRLRHGIPGIDEKLLRPLLNDVGFYTEQQADLCLLWWLALFVGGGLLALALPGPTVVWFLLTLVIGSIGPWFFLRMRARRRRATMVRGLPDVIDLLVVCVEAGLGLDQAMLRINEELADTQPELHVEFSRLMQHQRAGVPRLEAWQRMAERLHIPEIDAFVNMVLQAERFGTPIARALADFATLSRQKRTQAAEQAAAKTTVEISFPLVLFIFPCIFIVLLGPMLLNMARSLTSLFH
jgi:tight adherence protein C